MLQRACWLLIVPLVFLSNATHPQNLANPTSEPGTMRAAPEGASSSPRERAGVKAFGTTDQSLFTLVGYEFQPAFAQDADVIAISGGGERFCNEDCTLVANVSVPSGVELTGLELDYFDGSSTGQVVATMQRCPFNGTSCEDLATAASTVAGDSGEGWDFSAVSHTASNLDNTYTVLVDLTGGSVLTGVQGVRVYYRRQVSPAPGTATFNDVGTGHPFFQHVEALAASGITAGCGEGNFCPDQAITRGQMAVFLAVALGLHWPS